MLICLFIRSELNFVLVIDPLDWQNEFVWFDKEFKFVRHVHLNTPRTKQIHSICLWQKITYIIIGRQWIPWQLGLNIHITDNSEASMNRMIPSLLYSPIPNFFCLCMVMLMFIIEWLQNWNFNCCSIEIEMRLYQIYFIEHILVLENSLPTPNFFCIQWVWRL